MRTGRRAYRCGQRGLTYLLLLAALALGGTAMAGIGQSWQQRAQREREAELLFRGLQIRDALARWAAATPRGEPPLPARLNQLLVDERSTPPRHWLRQLYADPATGHADWLLLRDPISGGIAGVASRSRSPALRTQALPPGVTIASAAGTGPVALGDWQFVIATRSAGAASAPNETARRSP